MRGRSSHGYPTAFDERLRKGRATPGQLGRYILWDQTFDASGDRRLGDRFGWPIENIEQQVAGSLVFDWSDGDGINPLVGPILTLSGTVTSVATPWYSTDGTDVTATEFGNNENYLSVAAFDPGANDDIVVLLLFRLYNSAAAQVFFGTRNVGPGWQIFNDGAGSLVLWTRDTGATNAISFTALPYGWCLCGVTWNEDGNQDLYLNGTLVDSDSVAALGSISSGAGIGVNSRPDGVADNVSDIARGLVWYGVGIAELAPAAWHREVAASVFGIQNHHGSQGQPTIIRASSGAAARGTRYHIFGINAPRRAQYSGSQEGILCEGDGTNKVYNSVNNANTVGYTATGGMGIAAVGDAAALGTDLREFGPNVIQVTNATGVNQWVYCGAVTANLNEHSLSVFARYTAGANARIGLWDISLGVFTQDLGAVQDAYARTMIHGAVPSDTDCVWCLQIPNNTTLRFTMGQLEENPRCTSPIPNISTVAAATRLTDEIDTAMTPLDAEGHVEVGVTPYLWSAGETGVDVTIVRRATAGISSILYYDYTNQEYRSADGTNIAQVSDPAADGVRQICRASWGDAGLFVSIDGTQDLTAYDGALLDAGVIELGTGFGYIIDMFRIYRDE